MGQKNRQFKEPKEEREFDQRIIDLARVTRVMAGGKRMRFRACVAIGDKKGNCAVGIAKGADVTIAINKAVNQAKKNIIQVPIVNETIPHQVMAKSGSARILIKPAPQGTGIKAGGALRLMFILAGVPNVSAKIIGAGSKINNVNALMKAFKSFKPVKVFKRKEKKKEIKKADDKILTHKEIKESEIKEKTNKIKAANKEK